MVKIRKTKQQLPLYIMLIPSVILTFIYSYIPLAGLTMAFQDFKPAKGMFGEQTWVGWDNFKYLFQMDDFSRVLGNTLEIALWKIVVGLAVPIVLALLLNEVRRQTFKKFVQTMVYLPYFLSWVILAGIFVDIFSPTYGIVNQLLSCFGIEPIFFLGDAKIFPAFLIGTDVWKNAGFNTIVFLAALAGIDPTLYESAVIDGASRWKQTLYVTIPGILPIIVLMATLSIGNILSAGFDQVFNLYAPVVYETGDILDTFIYRLGLDGGQFSLATAVGLFKSVISLICISLSYLFAYKVADYRIF